MIFTYNDNQKNVPILTTLSVNDLVSVPKVGASSIYSDVQNWKYTALVLYNPNNNQYKTVIWFFENGQKVKDQEVIFTDAFTLGFAILKAVLIRDTSGGFLVLNRWEIPNVGQNDLSLGDAIVVDPQPELDITSPTIINIIPPANATYGDGDSLQFSVIFSEDVIVQGVPLLDLSIGINTRSASYVGGSNTNTLTFQYVVQGVDEDFDGISMISPIQLDGGSVRDAANNNAVLTFTPPNTSSVLVDGSVGYTRDFVNNNILESYESLFANGGTISLEPSGLSMAAFNNYVNTTNGTPSFTVNSFNLNSGTVLDGNKVYTVELDYISGLFSGGGNVNVSLGQGANTILLPNNAPGFGTFTTTVNTGNILQSDTLDIVLQSDPNPDLDSTWFSRTSPADISWRGVCSCVDGLFVAVAITGSGNRVMTSPDGITWTIGITPNNNNWNYIAFGNGLYVAVASTGSGNRVMTSPDGFTWTIRITPSDSLWRSVTFGNGLFVAVSDISEFNDLGHRVMTSPDGITWTIRTAPQNDWQSVIYGNGLFVAVGSGAGEKVMTSPDGITWTVRTIPNKVYTSVTYGGGLYVAVANSGVGDRVATSPDGITWTIRITPDNNYTSVTYGGGLYVAVANSGVGDRVMISPDGFTWTTGITPADNLWRSVTYGNGVFVAVASSGVGNRVMTMTPETLSSDELTIREIRILEV